MGDNRIKTEQCVQSFKLDSCISEQIRTDLLHRFYHCSYRKPLFDLRGVWVEEDHQEVEYIEFQLSDDNSAEGKNAGPILIVSLKNLSLRITHPRYDHGTKYDYSVK